MVLEVNENNVEDEVLKSEGIVLVDFYATWCGPCKMMSQVVDKIAEKYADKIKFAKLDIDESMDIAENNSVMSVPTFKIFKNGQSIKTFVGAVSEEDFESNLLEVINQ